MAKGQELPTITGKGRGHGLGGVTTLAKPEEVVQTLVLRYSASIMGFFSQYGG